MTTELAISLVGFLASIGFAVRSHFAARARAEETHGDAVTALIARAEKAEAEEAALRAALAASQAHARALHAELSAQMQGTRVARPEEKR